MLELVPSGTVKKLTSFAIKHGINLYLTHRTQKTLEKLADGGITIEEAFRSDSQIFRFNLFVESLKKASTDAKANLLKNLYLQCYKEQETESNDDVYYEIFSILGELSDRELRILSLLHQYKDLKIQSKHNDPLYSKYFEHLSTDGLRMPDGTVSDVFYYYASDQLGITAEVLAGLVQRISRTGLLEVTGMDANSSFQEYRFSALYETIRSRLVLEMER
ncbi:hypothetical protein DBZ36_10650 [Alginatibacterium sediminis]|uniref:Uncharacterized protein n=1 Tax=Alginatibacterium sediminis TaxID=2164068 RepID=A0A420EDU5_9ALTE|nr:hypothetical protein [Alginatibacterium sediminis]RKF18840.1 hypothetical protein DBZ36_10650 [Alginatibacterium sediminis]